MKTKEFTMLQMFSIVDPKNRLSTSMGDIYDILNHIVDQSLMTHHIPTTMKFIEKVNPQWLKDMREDLSAVFKTAGSDFKEATDYIQLNNKAYQVPQLTEDEMKGFGDFMVKNSLLLRVGDK